jgi:hypothetical protein
MTCDHVSNSQLLLLRFYNIPGIQYGRTFGSWGKKNGIKVKRHNRQASHADRGREIARGTWLRLWKIPNVKVITK